MKEIEIDKPDEFLKLIEAKKDQYLYQDHPNDGIDLFLDEELEQMGWYATTFEFITYRDIANFIESNCQGTLTYNNHPMGFNVFVIVDDIENVRLEVRKFIQQKIKDNPLDEYDDDQKEAIEYFL
jgi:hypothetical protein